MSHAEELAKALQRVIEDDCRDRRHIKWEFGKLDNDTLEELREEQAEAILEVLQGFPPFPIHFGCVDEDGECAEGMGTPLCSDEEVPKDRLRPHRMFDHHDGGERARPEMEDVDCPGCLRFMLEHYYSSFRNEGSRHEDTEARLKKAEWMLRNARKAARKEGDYLTADAITVWLEGEG